MPRHIVIEIPDDVPERHCAELAEAISSVAQAAGSAASPAFRVTVRHEFQKREPVAPRPRGFTVALRGYDRAQVDEWIDLVRRSAPPYPRPVFDVTLRGYHRAEVDEWVQQVAGVE